MGQTEGHEAPSHGHAPSHGYTDLAMGQAIGIPQARSTSGIGPRQACEPTASQPEVGAKMCHSTVHQLDMAMGDQVSSMASLPPLPQTMGLELSRNRATLLWHHRAVHGSANPARCQWAGARKTPCQLTHHERGATNAQCQSAQRIAYEIGV